MKKEMKEIIERAINVSFYALCADPVSLKDIHYGALTEATVIAFELGEITADELRYLTAAAKAVYLSIDK